MTHLTSRATGIRATERAGVTEYPHKHQEPTTTENRRAWVQLPSKPGGPTPARQTVLVQSWELLCVVKLPDTMSADPAKVEDAELKS